MSEAEEVKEYEILNDPIGDKGRGETITLKPSVASAFEDNLIPAGEDRPEEAVRSQVIGRRRVATLSDLPPGEEIEAGEYEVYRDPIGDVGPGETEYFEVDIARAFADNLVAPDADTDDIDIQSESVVELVDESGETKTETEVKTESEQGAADGSESDASEESADAPKTQKKSYDSPEEMLDQSVDDMTHELAGANLDDGQLEKLLNAEEAGENRKSAKEAIRAQMSGE